MKINIVFAGHIDHGKSTLIGRLLYDSENIKDDRVSETQRLAEEYKKRFEFAYFLDSFEDEMKENRTIDTAVAMFKGKNNYAVTDVPGHKEFLKNMLTGASYANIAILVISILDGIQEQTRRHLYLLNMIGIKEVYVVINKMDAVNYSKESFEPIAKKGNKLLRSYGYFGDRVIPISAINGDNVFKRSEKMDWYDGLTLIETLDNTKISDISKITRFVVQDEYLVGSEKVVVGRIESGLLKKGDKMLFQPSGVSGNLKKIMVFDGELKEAWKGDSIGIVLDCEVKRGDVGGLAHSPPIVVQEFLGQTILLDKTMMKGDILTLRCGTAKIKCEVKEIKEKIDSETGELIEQNPKEIIANDAAKVIYKTEPIVVEKFSIVPELGRFILEKNKNIGAGVVLNIF